MRIYLDGRIRCLRVSQKVCVCVCVCVCCEDSSRRCFEQLVLEMAATKGGASPMELDSPSGRAVASPSCEDSSRRCVEQLVLEMAATKGGASPMELDSPSDRALAGPSCEDSSRRCEIGRAHV